MINKLTVEQEAKIVEYRDRYFSQAVSVERADRKRAEEAARKLCEMGGVTVKAIEWVDNPQGGYEQYDRLGESLMDSLMDSLMESLRGSLRGSLRVSLRGSLRDSLRYSLRYSLWGSLMDSLMESLRGSLRGSLWGSLWGSLRDSLSNSLMESLMESLMDSLRDSLMDSLMDSLWDSLRDAGWVSFYTYCREVFGVSYDERSSKMLDCYNELLGSCFAIWVVPDGTVILCERPGSVKVEDGKLIDVDWYQVNK